MPLLNFTDKQNTQEFPIVERKKENEPSQDEKKEEEELLEDSPIIIEGPIEKMKKSAIKDAAKRSADFERENVQNPSEVILSPEEKKMEFLRNLFKDHKEEFGEISLAFLKMVNNGFFFQRFLLFFVFFHG